MESINLNIFTLKGAILLTLCSIPTVFGLKCIKGVDKFAASEGLDYFYECSAPGETPVLKQCSSGQIYDRKVGKCQRKKCKKVQKIDSLITFFIWQWKKKEEETLIWILDLSLPLGETLNWEIFMMLGKTCLWADTPSGMRMLSRKTQRWSTR